MALRYTQLFLLVIISASLLAVGTANRNLFKGRDHWKSGRSNHNKWWPRFQHSNAGLSPRRIIVGGSENWHFGFNYTEWAIRNGPFYFNDTLVFKFDPPSDTNTHPHSVYLLPDAWSFMNCNVTLGKQVANTAQGGGEGFEFVLDNWGPHFFVCGESNGFHCQNGMKFFVMPMFRPWF